MMKSKITKIQKILTKGIAIFIIAIFMLSSLSILKLFAVEIDDDVSTGSGIDEESTDIDYIGSEDSENMTNTIIKEIDQLKSQLAELNAKLNANFTYESFSKKIASNKIIEVSTELELRALSIYVAEGNNCSGKTFRLKNNIALTDTLEWSPIGDNNNKFKGTIDGSGYTISGILISIKQSYAGLVGYLDNGGAIKDLTIANSNISIPPEVDNKILNDLVDTETVNYSYLGVFAGYANGATIINCQNKTNVSGGNIVGGIAGMAKNTTIKYCSNAGNIKAYRTAGGISGTYNVEQENNEKNYTNPGDAPKYKKMIYRCKNSGSVYAIVANAGGISGTLRNNGVISYCLNDGEVSNAKNAFKVYVKAEESANITPQNAGGIVGVALADVEGNLNTSVNNYTTTIVECSLNSQNAKIDGYLDIGGIAGQLGSYDIRDRVGDGNEFYYIQAHIRYCINKEEFKYEDYKNKTNVGELAGRAGVKDSMRGIIRESSYVNYKKGSTLQDHKTTTNEIRAYGFAGNLGYYEIKNSEGTKTYSDELSFKQISDTDVAKIKDTTAPKLDNNIKATIVNYGSSQDFAIKGDVIKISIPFDEPINVNRIYPKLSLINGNIEADYIGIDENSLVFQYTVTGKENPSATSPYAIDNLKLTGTFYDIFGNKTSYSSEQILVGEPGSNLKIVNSNLESIKNASVTYSKDKIVYTISGFSNITEDEKLYFNKNSTMKVTASFAGNLTHPVNWESDIPKLQIKTNDKSGLFKDIEGTYNTSNYSLTYNVGLSESASVLVEGLYLTTQNEIYIKGESAGILNEEKTLVNVKNIIIDTVAPTLTLSTSVNNETESGRYTVGEDILIKATTSEAIDLENSVLPEINVNFSTSGLGKYNYQGENARIGNAKYMEAIKNADGTMTLKYRYTIQEGDEGEIQLSFATATGTIQDIAGNKTNIKEQYTEREVSLNGEDSNWNSNLGVTVEFYKNSVLSNNKITNKTYLSGTDDLVAVVTFGKKLYSYKADVNGQTYEKEIDINTAPSLYIPKDNGTLKADCISVRPQTDKTIVIYKLTDIANNYPILTSIKNLKLVNENNKQSVSIDGNPVSEKDAKSIKFTVSDSIEELNAGAIKVVNIENIVIDSEKINEKMQFNIYADTTAPTVEITAKDGINITNEDTVKYTFTWSEEVIEFNADDITVNGGAKGELSSPKNNGDGTYSYTMDITNSVASGNTGNLQVIVEKGTCQDLVGYENVRSESVIIVDKKAPTLENYTVYQSADKKQIIVEAIYDEAISDANKSTLDIKVGENKAAGDAKTPEILEPNNKVKYVYNISGADGGKVDITLSGTVKDIAGNNSEKLNTIIENDIELKKTVIKTNDAEYSFRKNYTNITDFANPTYFKANDKIYVTKTAQDNTNTERKIYTYTIVPTYEDNTHMKYMKLTEASESQQEGTAEFATTSSAGSIDITDANIYFDTTAPIVTTQINANNPKTGLYTTGEEFTIIATSSEVIQTLNTIPEIAVKFNRKTGIFNSGKAQYVETRTNEDGTISWVYRYVVSEGDEGEISLSYVNSLTIRDLAGNSTTLTSLNNQENIFELNGIQVDATAPTVKITPMYSKYDFNNDGYVDAKDVKLLQEYIDDLITNSQVKANIEQNGDVDCDGEISVNDTTELQRILEYGINITNEDTIKYTFTWSEAVTGFTVDDITVNNGTKEELSGPKDNGDGTYSYTMDITNSVASGNTGNLQVIVEKGACEDLVGYENVRTESNITVDKKAPMFIGLEAYATSNISVDEKVDTVKEYYKVGDTVTIIATFSENIENTATIPTLALQFSESGNAKGTVSNEPIKGNKITYTYTITAKDMGTLSVKGFSGTVKDAAGNETIVTKRTLDGDTIIADTKAPKLNELKVVSPDTNTYKAGTKIVIEAIYDEEIYVLENNTSTIKEITPDNAPDNAPELKIKFGGIASKGNATAVGYGETDSKEDKTKIKYTYTIVDADNELLGDNGILSIDSYKNKENVKVCDIAGNQASLDKKQTGNEITADTIRPEVRNVTASVESPTIANTGIYHQAGNTIKIVLTFSEQVSGAVLMPKIQIGFSEIEGQEPEVYNDYAYESDWNVNSTTIEYSYTIKDGDNGYLWIKVPENQFDDIAGNKNIAKGAKRLSNVYADTTKPTVTLLRDTSVEQNNQTITIKAQFNEDVYDLIDKSRETLTKENAPKLIYSFGTGKNQEIGASNISGAIITYTIAKDPVNDNGTLRYELAKGNLCDRAGNLYYEETTDTTAPELEGVYITTDSNYGIYCKKDVNIYVTAVFNEEIASQSMKLKIKLGEGQEELTGKVNDEDKTEVIFKCTVKENDNGKFTVLDVVGHTSTDESLEDKTYGYVKDAYGNTKYIFNFKDITINGEVIADTIVPTLTIASDAEITNKNIVKYTFTWSETVSGFEKDDIELINGLKGDFKAVPNTDGRVYTLEVETIGEGRQIVKVGANVCTDRAGNQNEERVTYNNVVIDYTKPVVRAKVNGGSYVINTDDNKSTLKETLVVNEEVSKFEYIWSKETSIPETGFTTINPSDIQINSDIKLETQVSETGRYYLYMKVTDLAGNTFVGRTNQFVVNFSRIQLTPNITTATNEDIIVTVNYGEVLTENRKAGIQGKTQSADSSKVIIGENGTIYAEATDIAGNKVYATKEITNIDKTAPKATIKYTTNEDGSVTATISFDEEATVTNNDGKTTYIFTENGEFTFEFVDSVGNKGTATAKVTNINKKEPTDPENPPAEEDKTAPEITFNYTTTTTTVGTTVGATITTNEDAIISYSWDNKNWTASSGFVRSVNVKKTPTTAGTYTLYAKAADKSSNTSSVSTLQFTVVKSDDDIVKPEIIFEDLTTIQKDGVKYVKVSPNYTTNNLTSKMNKDALLGKTPSYTNLTSSKGLKTGSEIQINGDTKYIVIVKGDVNCDGKVDFLNDIVMINNYRIGVNKNLKYIQILAGDINNNSGSIEFIPDIVAMNNYRLGRINVL